MLTAIAGMSKRAHICAYGDTDIKIRVHRPIIDQVVTRYQNH